MKTSYRYIASLSAAAAALFTCFLPEAAVAWGQTGHEAVAFVAWQLMNPTARGKAM